MSDFQVWYLIGCFVSLFVSIGATIEDKEEDYSFGFYVFITVLSWSIPLMYIGSTMREIGKIKEALTNNPKGE